MYLRINSDTSGIHVPTLMACRKAWSGLCPLFYSFRKALMAHIKGRVEEMLCVLCKQISHEGQLYLTAQSWETSESFSGCLGAIHLQTILINKIKWKTITSLSSEKLIVFVQCKGWALKCTSGNLPSFCGSVIFLLSVLSSCVFL